MAPDTAPRPRKRLRLGLLAAILVPAVLAAAAVLALDHPPRPHTRSARELARQADAPTAVEAALAPLALRPRTGEAARAPLGARLRPALPVRLAIPGARVHTKVVRAPVVRGALKIPGVGIAGWYSGGPRPGEPGRAVIIGHLDTLKGPGLFARVPFLERGDAIAVTDAQGRAHRFRVVGAARARKDRFPRDEVYGYSRRPVLVLVTCGGPFKPGRGYRDNVLVFARAA